MKWMIIIFIMMSLIGSMMWVMPTQRQKYQAALRMKAKLMGFQVQLERVTAPRAKGEVDPETRDMTVYRLLRQGLSSKDKSVFKSWQIYRVESISDTGLPQGWSWSTGERTLGQDQLDQLQALIEQLPAGVFSVESTPVHISAYWDEEGGDKTLEALKDVLGLFVEKGI